MSYPCAACCFRVQQCSVRFGSLMVLYASRDGIMPGSFCKRTASSAYHAWGWANIFVLHDLFLNVISTAFCELIHDIECHFCVELQSCWYSWNVLNYPHCLCCWICIWIIFLLQAFFFFFFVIFYFRYMTFKCFNTVTSCKLVIFFPV